MELQRVIPNGEVVTNRGDEAAKGMSKNFHLYPICPAFKIPLTTW